MSEGPTELEPRWGLGEAAAEHAQPQQPEATAPPSPPTNHVADRVPAESPGDRSPVDSSNAALQRPQQPGPGRGRRALRAFGLGLITGAADDDPSAIGTYASAGAKFGPAFLWMAPITFPMMIAAVYLSGKLGQVSGQGLFA